jgi:hypothetical protein
MSRSWNQGFPFSPLQCRQGRAQSSTGPRRRFREMIDSGRIAMAGNDSDGWGSHRENVYDARRGYMVVLVPTFNDSAPIEANVEDVPCMVHGFPWQCVCVYYCRTYYKAVCGGGGGQ